MATGLMSLTSRASMTVLVIGGVVCTLFTQLLHDMPCFVQLLLNRVLK